jgi:hypothetical protein
MKKVMLMLAFVASMVACSKDEEKTECFHFMQVTVKDIQPHVDGDTLYPMTDEITYDKCGITEDEAWGICQDRTMTTHTSSGGYTIEIRQTTNYEKK